MRNSVLKYILIVSLLLNFSFLGAAGYTYFRHPHYGPPFAGPAAFQGPLGAEMPTSHLFDALSLKPEQVKIFQQKATLFHRAVSMKREEVDRLRGALIALMRADRRDDKAIEETIGRINERQKEMQKMVVSHMLEFKSMLGLEQQKKFLDLVANAMGQRGEPACPLEPPKN
jgi:Spy/CpxP family protein refolding chaperone